MEWHDPQHDSLDELLRAARWPEPQSAQFDQLERDWQRLVWQRRRRVWGALLAAAVMLPIAALLTVRALVNDRLPVEIEIAEPRKSAPPHVVQKPVDVDRDVPPVVVAPSDDPRPQPQYVRDPNVFEQALVLLHRHNAGLERPQAHVATTNGERVDPVTMAVQRLIDEPELNIDDVVQNLVARCSDCERRLRRRLEAIANDAIPQPNTEESASESRAVLRLLAAVATQASLPVLVEAAGEVDCPAEVLNALARHSSVEQLAARVRDEAWPKRQSHWLAALIERKTPAAVATYLEFAEQPTTSAPAIEAARSVKTASLDGLFAALFDSRVTIRLSAARLLGKLNDPIVSKRLAQMALDNVGRREALVALLRSSDPVAHQFLTYAQNDLALAPSLRALGSQLSNPVH